MDVEVELKGQLVNESSLRCLTIWLPILIGPIGTVLDVSFSGIQPRGTVKDSLIIQTHTAYCLLVLRLSGSRSLSSNRGSKSSKGRRGLRRLRSWLGVAMVRLGLSCL